MRKRHFVIFLPTDANENSPESSTYSMYCPIPEEDVLGPIQVWATLNNRKHEEAEIFELRMANEKFIEAHGEELKDVSHAEKQKFIQENCLAPFSFETLYHTMFSRLPEAQKEKIRNDTLKEIMEKAASKLEV